MNAAKRKSFDIFPKYMRSLPQFVLSNLMFAMPMAASFLIVWLIEKFTVPVIFIRFLPILTLTPFYCGLCKITKDAISGRKIDGIKDFFRALASNLKSAVLHGIIFYVVSIIDYFSIVFYYRAAARSSAMYILLGVCVALAIITVFCFFYVSLITVTLDIKFKYIYKDAFFMSIGELPRNFLALLSCSACAAIVTMLFTLTGTFIGAVIFLVILLIFILPVTVSYFVNATLYPSVYRLLICNEEAASTDCDVQLMQQFETKPIDSRLLQGDEDELVFYDGKMIKRSKLIEIYKSIE